MVKTVEIVEKRQQGALLLITHQDKVLAIEDSVKPELSAGVDSDRNYSVDGMKRRWNTFGGGRQGNETLRSGLRRETIEEMGENLKTLPNRVTIPRKLTQIIYPFLVGQIYDQPNGPKKIDEIAVTVGQVSWNSLTPKMRGVLERAVEGQRAQWMFLEHTSRLRFPEANAQERSSFRPQFITAATIHFLQESQLVSNLAEVIASWNMQLFTTLLALALSKNLTINNGTFEVDGHLKSTLPKKMTSYLLPPVKEAKVVPMPV